MNMPADLPETTVAVMRLPVPLAQMTALCEMFRDPSYNLHQSGDWIVVTKKEVKP